MRLEVDLARPGIFVNGNLQICANMRIVQFLHHLVRSAPNLLSYDDIEEHVLRPNGITQPRDAYIRKLKLNAARFLAKTTGLQGIILTMRSAGFRLGDEWEHLEVPGELPEVVQGVLREFGEILENVIGVMQALAFVKTDNGYLVLNCEKHETRVEALSERYLATIGRLRQNLPDETSLLFRQHLDGAFENIFSYVHMARMGKTITEAAWRILFVRELENHYARLVQTVQDVWHAAAKQT